MEETIKEKEYIKNEAKTLFRKNKNVSVLTVLNFWMILRSLFVLPQWWDATI